jgi:polar amino acid transport system substrate-binding protein
MSERIIRFVGVFCAAIFLAALLPLESPAATQVGSDVSGAPFEYFSSPGHKMLGFDIDLLKAMSIRMGPILVINHTFDDLLAAVRRGQFGLAMSAISDNREREKVVDFIDYFIAGGGITVRPGNPHRIFAINALCGYSVAIEKGTSYLTDLQKQSDNCKAIGLGPIEFITYDTDDAAFDAFLGGKGDAYIADYPVAANRLKTNPAASSLVLAGGQFDVVPYGIAVKKGNAAMQAAAKAALLSVIADGTYDLLLKKWDIEAGALRSAPINAGTLFQK